MGEVPIAAKTITEISGYSKISLRYIHELAAEIIDLLKTTLYALCEARKPFLEKVQTKSMEIFDVWTGLNSHIKKLLFSHPDYIPSVQHDNLVNQTYQMSFLISSIEREVSSCCATKGPRATDVKLAEFKACFELLKSQLEGSLDAMNE